MRKIRLYQYESLNVGNTIVLNNRNHHYLSKVLRIREGNIILFNGDGYEYTAHIHIVGSNIHAQISSLEQLYHQSSIQIILIQAVAKSDKMDYIVQKATELGVDDIIPLLSSRVIVKLNEAKAEKKRIHWQEIAINAAEQSGRTTIPTIHKVCSFDALELSGYSTIYLLEPSSHTSLYSYYDANNIPNVITGIIGPEGGFSEKEITILTNKSCKLLSLGTRVLRTETASLSFLSNIELLYGNNKIRDNN